jgi:hypothetical protein
LGLSTRMFVIKLGPICRNERPKIRLIVDLLLGYDRTSHLQDLCSIQLVLEASKKRSLKRAEIDVKIDGIHSASDLAT